MNTRTRTQALRAAHAELLTACRSILLALGALHLEAADHAELLERICPHYYDIEALALEMEQKAIEAKEQDERQTIKG